ncbi:hypothetical protein [Streptomyces sp. WMMB303]|uniref:hypothetical protein n=1 Tax=Streptomyces sp. WMMB303 TaxID=3034154 RepID=UPI0023EB16F9|nr:hypothetical protein [Streptomyces sp. WMMB303]MDF4250934.1 hypothetical protein [Streptomyces sp. WMMB303]
MGGNAASDQNPSPGMKPGGHLPQNTDLVHSESKKKAAARYLAETLGPETHKAGSKADGDTETLTGNPESPTGRGKLHGWEVWTGIRHRLTTWRTHHKHLTRSLSHEREALMDVNTILSGMDIATRDAFGSATPRLQPGLDKRPGSSLDNL